MSNLCLRHSEVDMSNTKLSDHQLFEEAKAALCGKDRGRAKALFKAFFDRSAARDKARAANDPA
jgi:hypothetical protein